MTKIIATGLSELRDFLTRIPDIASKAASYAINDVSTGTGLRVLRNAIYDEIDFPANYIDQEKLGLTKRATPDKLEAVITGRDRPTSLAQFAKGKRGLKAKGVSVSVKPGRQKFMSNAWLVGLNNGNTGLAIRLKPGERLINKRKTASVELSPNVYLLYGPSVNQALSGVADDQGGEIANLIAKEFLRQVTRLTRN